MCANGGGKESGSWRFVVDEEDEEEKEVAEKAEGRSRASGGAADGVERGRKEFKR